jgi:hypothetical protein
MSDSDFTSADFHYTLAHPFGVMASRERHLS